MKSRIFSLAIALMILAVATVPVMAIPEVQTYILGAEYGSHGLDEDTWITNNPTFTVRSVGCWAPEGQSQPDFETMELYVVIGVPKDGAGSISINGVHMLDLTEADFTATYPTGVPPLSPSFYNHEPMKRAIYYELYLGTVDNSAVAAQHYDEGTIVEWGWGDMIDIDVAVSGFDWVHFDSYGIRGRTYYENPYSHDASYYVPEPGTLGLLGIGLLGMVPILRRKK